VDNLSSRSVKELEEAVATFGRVRPRLFGIAYRMLGSVAEAEDVVQDTWLRWQGADRGAVRNPDAFLATTATRLAINALQSARVRRETYVGPWLPEPVDTSADPQLGAERAAALEFAVLVLLEKLSPTERAAYVLREAFDYPYPRIAEIIDSSEASARQLVSRARKHIADHRRRPVPSGKRQELLDSFLSAARTGDLAALEGLLAEDVVSTADGGGRVRASRIQVVGRDRVARYIQAFASRFWDGVDASLVTVNGEDALRLRRDGSTMAIVTVSASGAGIDTVSWVMNPEKLSQL
jgi:RNA polymerase sigma-70 factor (TIGR02957 family)